MNRIKIFTGIVILLCLSTNAAGADDQGWCGEMIKGNWRVVDAGNIGYHILEKVKVKYDRNNQQYDVEIEDNSTPKTRYEGKNFRLSCTARPPSAVLTGDVEIDGCAHTLEISYPYIENGVSDWHQVGFRYPNPHGPGTCSQHPTNVHNAAVHPGSAHGSDN